jgi:hypothetical protein
MWQVGTKIISNLGTQAIVTKIIDSSNIEVKITRNTYGKESTQGKENVQDLPMEYWREWRVMEESEV